MKTGQYASGKLLILSARLAERSLQCSTMSPSWIYGEENGGKG